MKKLKLSELNLGNEAEVLTREQLKKVLGGDLGSGQKTTVGDVDCYECAEDDDVTYGRGKCADHASGCQVPSGCIDYKGSVTAY